MASVIESDAARRVDERDIAQPFDRRELAAPRHGDGLDRLAR
jgi:hypothetical protein